MYGFHGSTTHLVRGSSYEQGAITVLNTDSDATHRYYGSKTGGWVVVRQHIASLETEIASGNSNPLITTLDDAWAVRTSLIYTPSTKVRNIALPAITGDIIVGSLAGCTTGAFEGDNLSFSYQWLRDGAVLPGVTGTTYSIDGEGANFSCIVTARNGEGTDFATSPAVTPTTTFTKADSTLISAATTNFTTDVSA